MSLAYKKGQVEDIFADLIPALIIMGIAIYLMSTITVDHKGNVEDRIREVESQLASRPDINLYLKAPLIVSKGFAEASGTSATICHNEKLTTADLIAKIDTTKPVYTGRERLRNDPCFELLRLQTFKFEDLVKEYYGSISVPQCLDVRIEYPDGKVFAPSECPVQEYKETGIPLKDGKSANVKFSISTGLPPRTIT